MITKTQILAAVNSNTERAETNIDDILYDVLVDISSREALLKSSTSGILSGNETTITKPTDAVQIDYIHFPNENSNNLLYRITFEEYLRSVVAGFAIRGETVYISPSLTSDRAYTIYYSKKHSSDLDTIEFADDFKMAIVAGCTAAVFKKYQQYNDSQMWEITYANEIEKLSDRYTVEVPLICRYGRY